MHGEHSPFLWFSLIPGFNPEYSHVWTAMLIAAVVIVLTFVARLQLQSAMKAQGGALVPESRLTFRNFFEIIAEQLYGMTESTLGHHDAPRFFPLIGSLFIFIVVSNLMGLIPGFLPPTDNLNTTLALGVFVFIYYNIAGLRAHGLGYLKHFLGPVAFLAPLMVVIEIASHLFRPLSLALRLRGNIMGDHIVLGIFSDLVPIVVPIIFYGMGLFVALIQAFVFCLMTMVYISLSTAHDH